MTLALAQNLVSCNGAWLHCCPSFSPNDQRKHGITTRRMKTASHERNACRWIQSPPVLTTSRKRLYLPLLLPSQAQVQLDELSQVEERVTMRDVSQVFVVKPGQIATGVDDEVCTQLSCNSPTMRPVTTLQIKQKRNVTDVGNCHCIFRKSPVLSNDQQISFMRSTVVNVALLR